MQHNEKLFSKLVDAINNKDLLAFQVVYTQLINFGYTDDEIQSQVKKSPELKKENK